MEKNHTICIAHCYNEYRPVAFQYRRHGYHRKIRRKRLTCSCGYKRRDCCDACQFISRTVYRCKCADFTVYRCRKKENIHTAVTSSMMTALIFGIVLAVVGYFTALPLLKLINTSQNIMNHAVAYLRIYCFSIPFLMIYDFGSAIFRARGDSKRPLIALIISGTVNVLLNLLFVVVFSKNLMRIFVSADETQIIRTGASILLQRVLFMLASDCCFCFTAITEESINLKCR